jgi:hypothetical protein
MGVTNHQVSILADRKSAGFSLNELRHSPTAEEIAISIKYLNSGGLVDDVHSVFFVDRDCPRLHEPAILKSATSPNEDVLTGCGRAFEAATNCHETKQPYQGGVQLDCP